MAPFLRRAVNQAVLQHRRPCGILYRLLTTTNISSSSKFPRVVGCGSNVVDQFMRLRAIPKLGEKGYFSSPTTIYEASIVGGVTLNHLSWAALLGVPTSGLFLQGKDPSGELIRAEMLRQGVSIEFVQASSEYTTAESYVLLQDDGERSILMATGSTSQIDASAARKFFASPVAQSSIFTTEISQVPLSGVMELLGAARDAGGVVSVLDVDISPSVAVDEARLGSMDDVISCVKQATVLKPAMHAAVELMQVLDPTLTSTLPSMSAADLAARLRDATECELVALTDGGSGCALATESHSLVVPVRTTIAKVTDATGAGDAFLGGLVASLFYDGMPTTPAALHRMGALANATGAACCHTLGGLPANGSQATLAQLLDGGEAADFADKLLVGADSDDDDVAADETLCSGFYTSLGNDADALVELASSVAPTAVDKCVSLIDNCSGKVLVTGLGKSGVVARRMAVSLASIGIAAHYVHAAEWTHGDLGTARRDDVIIALSHSGSTTECVTALEMLKERGVWSISITSNDESSLAKNSDVSVAYNIPSDAEPVGGAPTCSIVAQEAIVNGVMCELIHRRDLTEADFKRNHPGGALGAKSI
eukprot:m.351297 g.351297  ORF g.351297 m.351297 type:complete len:596 (-) comp20697_c0_seq1:137-1924(-)